MKRLMTLFCIALGLALSQVSVTAQPERQQSIPKPSSFSFPDIERVPLPSTGTPSGLIARPRREGRIIRKGILAPGESDVNAHQFLLSLEKTGMMRLLPREGFDWERNNVGKRVDMRGGGAYYSFHYRSHEYGYGSDVQYERGCLSVGFAGVDYGFLTDLGDTPLEPIDAEDFRAAFFLNYKPPRKENEARLEKRKFSTIKFSPISGRENGILVDGIVYGRQAPAKVNHTYLLRSIVYDSSDLLVAFRVVKINDDGGLTIAWKILKEFSPPKLHRR